jgi:ABC-type bacteriocin/lantibiotic exporter with double-glycine peptidase domain
MTYYPQLDETDCNAACLAMVASHFQSRLSIAAIRQIAGTDQKGTTNLAGMVQAGNDPRWRSPQP